MDIGIRSNGDMSCVEVSDVSISVTVSTVYCVGPSAYGAVGQIASHFATLTERPASERTMAAHAASAKCDPLNHSETIGASAAKALHLKEIYLLRCHLSL